MILYIIYFFVVVVERNVKMCMHIENDKISVLNEETSSRLMLSSIVENVYYFIAFYFPSFSPQCYKASASVVLALLIINDFLLFFYLQIKEDEEEERIVCLCIGCVVGCLLESTCKNEIKHKLHISHIWEIALAEYHETEQHLRRLNIRTYDENERTFANNHLQKTIYFM